LQVVVEAEGVETPVEVLVAGDVAAGAAGGVELMQAAEDMPAGGEKARPPRRLEILHVGEGHVEDVVERARLDDVAAVHVFLAELQVGIEDDGTLGGVAGETDAYRLTPAVAVAAHAASGVGGLQRTLAERPV